MLKQGSVRYLPIAEPGTFGYNQSQMENSDFALGRIAKNKMRECIRTQARTPIRKCMSMIP